MTSEVRPGFLFQLTLQDDLRNIITHRLPVLLNRGGIKLVIIDSIAALFRVEYSLGETSKRAKILRSSGAQLHKLSNLYSIPVVCVNQVCVWYFTYPAIISIVDSLVWHFWYLMANGFNTWLPLKQLTI